MKTLRWNKSQILSEFSNCENLKDLIEAIESDCRKNSLLVCAILVNGMSLEEEDEGRFANTNIKEIHQIEVEVGDLKEIVSGLMHNLFIWMPYIKEVAEDSSETIRLGKMDLAERSFGELLDAIQDLIRSLTELHNTRSLLPEFSFVNEIITYEQKLSEVLKQLVPAFEKSDYVLVADIIEYDLSNVFDQLTDWIKLSIDEVANTWSNRNESAGNGSQVGSGEVSP